MRPVKPAPTEMKGCFAVLFQFGVNPEKRAS